MPYLSHPEQSRAGRVLVASTTLVVLTSIISSISVITSILSIRVLKSTNAATGQQQREA